MREIKRLRAQGAYIPERDDAFELFITSTNIRWTYYKETAKVLGNTYGMCVLQVRRGCFHRFADARRAVVLCLYALSHTSCAALVCQDFEALTPNILCRTIETVEGGGIVVLLLHTMKSLKQLYALSMVSCSACAVATCGCSCCMFVHRTCMPGSAQRPTNMSHLASMSASFCPSPRAKTASCLMMSSTCCQSPSTCATLFPSWMRLVAAHHMHHMAPPSRCPVYRS